MQIYFQSNTELNLDEIVPREDSKCCLSQAAVMAVLVNPEKNIKSTLTLTQK